MAKKRGSIPSFQTHQKMGEHPIELILGGTMELRESKKTQTVRNQIIEWEQKMSCGKPKAINHPQDNFSIVGMFQPFPK